MVKNAKKQNRILYIISVMILLILAVLVAVTSIARRNLADPVPGTGTAPRTDTSQAQSGMAQTAGKPDVPPAETKPADARTEAPSEPAVKPMPRFTAMPAAGEMTKGYSSDIPVFSLTMNDYRTHCGMDFSGTAGDPVYAAADGVIGNVWTDPFMGSCLSIVHSGGAVSIYRNLAEEPADNVGTGATVKAGQLVGYIGETALIECAEEPHLHYELTVNGKTVDPGEYLPVSSATGAFEN